MTPLPSNLYPSALFEDRKPVPNLMIRLNAPEQEPSAFDPTVCKTEFEKNLVYLPSCFLLFFANNIDRFHIRNITLFGTNPFAYPALESALALFAAKPVHVGMCLFPNQLPDKNPQYLDKMNTLFYRLGPFSGENEISKTFRSLPEEITLLRSLNPSLEIRAILYVSDFCLKNLDRVIHLVENAGFDHLDFFSPNLYINLLNQNEKDLCVQNLVPSKEEIKSLEKDFWNILEQRWFETHLFDLNLCRRQMERVIQFFGAIRGLGEFAPPFCRASRVSFFIEPTGEVRTCPYQKIVGNLRSHSLVQISESEELKLFQANLNLAKSPICPSCPGAYPHLLWKTR